MLTILNYAVSSLLVLVGLLYFNNWDLLIWALIMSCVLLNCITITVHEGWSHGYILPKNRIVGAIIDYITYIFFNTSRLRWQFLHKHHHKFWKCKEDWDQFGVDHTPWFLYLVFLYRTAPPAEITKEFSKFDQYYTENLQLLTVESRFLEKYYVPLNVITHLVILTIFGAETYFYFLFFQVWMLIRLFKLFTEILPHSHKTLEDEADMPFLFILCGGIAYHTSHHRNKNQIIFGKGWLKYINIQYYFTKLFFNIKVKNIT